MSEPQKIIMKTPRLEGVDMSVNNLEMFTSVRIRWTKVSHKMTKKNGITFLGTKEQLLPGDIIQVGNMGLKYKVISLKKLEDRPQGYIYRVRRVDGAHTTSTDIDNILVGQKVQIVSNKTFQQIFEQHPDVPHIEICPKEIPDTEFCCVKSTGVEPITPPTVVPPTPCFNYLITIPGETAGELNYRNCEGENVTENLEPFREDYVIIRCGINGQTSEDIFFNVGVNNILPLSFTETSQVCPITCQSSITISYTPCVGVSTQVVASSSGVVYGATLFYEFTISGINYEVYNQPLNDNFITPELGVWYIYSYGTNSDIGELTTVTPCPTGAFILYGETCEVFSGFIVQ